jgi:hypothetical protein
MGGTLIICTMCINLLNTLTIVEKNFDDFFLSYLMRIINREENNRCLHTRSNGKKIKPKFYLNRSVWMIK